MEDSCKTEKKNDATVDEIPCLSERVKRRRRARQAFSDHYLSMFVRRNLFERKMEEEGEGGPTPGEGMGRASGQERPFFPGIMTPVSSSSSDGISNVPVMYQ